MVFKNKYEPSSKDQPSAVKKLLIPEENESVSDQIYQNENKIKIPSSYKKGHITMAILKKL